MDAAAVEQLAGVAGVVVDVEDSVVALSVESDEDDVLAVSAVSVAAAVEPGIVGGQVEYESLMAEIC